MQWLLGRNRKERNALAKFVVTELECQMGGGVAVAVHGVHVGACAQARLHPGDCQPARLTKSGGLPRTFMQRMLPFIALCMSSV